MSGKLAHCNNAGSTPLAISPSVTTCSRLLRSVRSASTCSSHSSASEESRRKPTFTCFLAIRDIFFCDQRDFALASCKMKSCSPVVASCHCFGAAAAYSSHEPYVTALPSTMAMTRLANSRRKKRSWLTTKTVPSKAFKASSKSSRVGMSKWLVGSSRTRSSHGLNKKLANATRAFSPPLKVQTGWSWVTPASRKRRRTESIPPAASIAAALHDKYNASLTEPSSVFKLSANRCGK
mmetsp:Transcript_28266/g.62543  ORF Transcript_28266/g.62543 Transcript_28266/m.62543 type:complete len:236 (+) Transcript_28266:24-731(+)